MIGGQRIKDHQAETRLFTQRALVATICIAIGIFALIARLIWLQIVRYDYFAEQARGNRVRIEPLPPSRGLIYDRNGVALALNSPSFQLQITREQVPDLDAALKGLAALDLLDRGNVDNLKRDIRRRRSFEAMPLKLSLNEEELARFAVHQQDFPGVEIKPRLSRYYPLGSSGVHALGYVGIISEDDQKVFDDSEYAGSVLVGKSGIEKSYEVELHGKAGYQQLLVNAQGRRVDQLGTGMPDLVRKEPMAGNDLYLSIDERLQKAAEEMLGKERGAVVAIDPNNGEVLALVSTPGFDPNLFGRGLSQAQYRDLYLNPERPMYNRAIQGTYPSGSTIKPFMAMAGLYYNVITPEDTKLCPGYFTLPNVLRPWRELDKKNGHDVVDMTAAIAESCDVYFFSLASTLGVDRIHDYLATFGFGAITGIDIEGEKKALLPSSTWRKSVFKDKERQGWRLGDTVNIAIGQGDLSVTPIQLASAVSAIAMHGKRFQPKLIHSVRNAVTNEVREPAPRPLTDAQSNDPGNWGVIINAMHEATVNKEGTARASFIDTPYAAAGKTGTAQAFSLGRGQYNAAQLAKSKRDHSWFVAFAPIDAPKIAVSVIVENGGFGSQVAAPIARRLFDIMLLTPDQLEVQEAKRRTRLAKQQGMDASAAAAGNLGQ
ncbi:MAG: penicillin-binding protein 2 [Steroidobacteraceae bacterium]